jgi:hypothetical protein
MGSAPAMAMFGGRLYLAFRANDSSNALYITSTSDGVHWQAPADDIGDIELANAPAMTVFGGQLYIAFRANNSSDGLYLISSSDGANWTSPKQVSGIQIGSSPALAAFGGKLYAAYRADNSSYGLCIISSSDGVNWTTPAQTVSGIQMGSKPALVVFDGRLYAAYGNPAKTLCLTSTANGTSWTSAKAIGGIQLAGAPAITVFEGRLYIAFRANSSSNSLCTTSSADGVTWVTPVQSIAGSQVGDAPAIAVFSGWMQAAQTLPASRSSSLGLGGDANVGVPSPTGLTGASAFTLELWVYPNSLVGTQTLLSVQGKGFDLTLGLSAATPVLEFMFDDESIKTTLTGPDINIGELAFIAGTLDSSTATLTLYVNGAEASQQIFKSALSFGSTATYSAVVGPLQGSVGRLALWSQARDAEEVLADGATSSVIDPVAEPHLEVYVDFTSMPAVDQSGLQTSLSYESGAQLVFAIPGLALDGASYVNVGSGAQLDFPGSQSFTIDGWFYPAGYGALASRAASGTVEYLVEFISTGSGTGAVKFTRSKTSVVTANLPLYNWYHYTATYNGPDNDLSIYINGNLQTTLIAYGDETAPSVSADTLIGASAQSGSAGDFFTGLIQNTRLWNAFLDTATTRQWLYNQPVTDPALVGSFDFTVTPPVDTTDLATVTLEPGAAIAAQSGRLDPTFFGVDVGAIYAVNAAYLNQTPESPNPPPTSATQQVGAAQPTLWTQQHFDASWQAIEAILPEGVSSQRKARLRKRFEAGFAEAERRFRANPKLATPITTVVQNGVLRATYHGPDGDVLLYEGAAATTDPCTVWWIGFVYTLTVCFLQAIGLVPTNGTIATRIYNLVMSNAAAAAAITALIELPEITATAALGVITVLYQKKLLWPILKLALSSLGWWSLLWVLKQAFYIVSGTEEFAILAGFIVWAAQLTTEATSYSASCPSHST